MMLDAAKCTFNNRRRFTHTQMQWKELFECRTHFISTNDDYRKQSQRCNNPEMKIKTNESTLRIMMMTRIMMRCCWSKLKICFVFFSSVCSHLFCCVDYFPLFYFVISYFQGSQRVGERVKRKELSSRDLSPEPFYNKKMCKQKPVSPKRK